jgi:hypothetical protein
MLNWDRLKELLEYDPDTGIFIWRKNKGSIKSGTIAGGKTCNGYITICIDGNAVLAHRLAWFYCFKEWPDKGIDHINRNGLDNRLDNLREADQTLNNYNTNIRKDNTTGYKGVYIHGSGFRARVTNKNKNYNLGTFETIEEAAAKVKEFKEKQNLL